MTSEDIHIENAARALAESRASGRVKDALERLGETATGDPVVDSRRLIELADARTQYRMAALYCGLRGVPEADPKELTRLLAAAFPTHRVGRRHGPHYVSRARTGLLPDVLNRPDEDVEE
jgi:hypothetical protein